MAVHGSHALLPSTLLYGSVFGNGTILLQPPFRSALLSSNLSVISCRYFLTGRLGKPQFISDSLHAGLYLIKYSFDREDQNYTRDRDCKYRIITLDEKVLRDHLAHKRTTRPRTTAAKIKRRKR
jgi:hypothetical protein